MTPATFTPPVKKIPRAGKPAGYSADQVEQYRLRLKTDWRSLRDWAARLGLSPNTLIEFRCGLDDSGNLILPERDASGLEVGAQVRKVDGSKIQLSGSKRGLFF